MEITRSWINSLPKAELHLHIEGSLEPELMMKLSKRNNVDIPFSSVEEIKEPTILLTFSLFLISIIKEQLF